MKFGAIVPSKKKLANLAWVFSLLALVIFSSYYIVPKHNGLYPLKEASGKVVLDPQYAHTDSGELLTEAMPKALQPQGHQTQLEHRTVIVGSIHVPILMYHHVGQLPEYADSIRRDLTVSPEDFESQVQWLKHNGYEAISLEQVYLATQKQLTLPAKPVVFTFDDGYSDVFENAVPILQTYGMVGSFAVVPGLFGQPDYTNWDSVTAAHKAGMEIVSHTETHFDGSSKKYDNNFIKRDLERSLSELDGHLGGVPPILVYPYGHYTPDYIILAESVGFKMGLTTAFGTHVNSDDLMHTPRVRVHGGESLERFKETLLNDRK